MYRKKYRQRKCFDWKDAISYNSEQFNNEEFLQQFRMHSTGKKHVFLLKFKDF